MADLLVKMSVQDNLTQSIKQAKQAVSDFSNETNRMDKIQEKFDRLQRGTVPLKRQMRELQTIMAEMNFKGLSNTKEFSQIAQYAGSVADALGDARQAVNVFANDTMKLQATVQAFQAVTGAISIATGVMGLLGVESDKVQEVMLKVQSAIALVNGVQSIANLLNKDSALMLRIKQIAMQANTKATLVDTVAEKANTMITAQNTAGQTTNSVAIAANTVATGSNTVAIKAWNLVKAVSKALLGDFTGLLLVGATALIGYSIATSDSTKKIDDQNEATKKAQKVQDRFRKTVIMSADDMIKKYRSLKSQYDKLSTTMQKKQFIKDNQSAFEELGESITKVKDAQDYLVNNTSKVISNFRLIANEARDNFREKIVSSASELIDKYYTLRREWTNLSSTMQKNQFIKDNQTAFNELGGSIHSAREAEDFFVNNTSKVVQALRQRAVQLALMDRQKQIIENYLSKLDEIDNKYAQPGKTRRADYSAGSKIDKNSKDWELVKEMIRSENGGKMPNQKSILDKYYSFDKSSGEIKLTQYTADLLNLNNTLGDYENRLTDSTNAQKEFNDQLSANEKRIQEIAKEIGAGFNFDTQVKDSNPKHVKDFAQQISDVLKKYINGEILFDDAKKKLEKLNERISKKGLKPIDIDFKLTKASEEKYAKQVQETLEKYSLHMITRESAIQDLETFTKETEKRGVKPINVPLKLDEIDIKNFQEKAKNLTDMFNSGQIDFTSYISGLDEISSEYNKMGDSVLVLKAKNDLLRTQFDTLTKFAKELKFAIDNGLDTEGKFANILSVVNSLLAENRQQQVKTISIVDLHKEAISKLDDEYDEWMYRLENGLWKGDIDSMWSQFANRYSQKGVDLPPIDLETRLRFSDSSIAGLFNDLTKRAMADAQISELLKGFDIPVKLGKIKQKDVDNLEKLINDWRETQHLQPINLKLTSDGIQETTEQLEKLRDLMKGMTGNAGQLIKLWQDIGEVMESNATKFEKAGAMIGGITQSLQALAGTGESAKIAAIAAAIGQLILSYATMLSKSMTIWDWIGGAVAGAATIATIVSQFQSYSQGGIIGGSSMVGDRLLMGNARVNSGEMILNGTQQKKLFTMLNSNSIGFGRGVNKVEFEISGRNLRGVLNNYNSKISKQS